MKSMKQLMNRILIGVLFLFGVLLIPAGQVKATTLTDTYHSLYITTSVSHANFSSGSYITNEAMAIVVDVQSTHNYCNSPIPTRSVGWSIKVGNATATNYNYTISDCGGGAEVIIYPPAPSTAGNYNVVFNFGNNVIITTPFTVILPPATTVDVKVNNVDGPITVNGGSSVQVMWTSTYATSCTCQCQNPTTGVAIDCGGSSTQTPKSNCGGATPTNNDGIDIKSIPWPIPNIIVPTKFYVNCT